MDTDLLTAASQASAAVSSVLVFLFGGLVPGLLLTISATLAMWHRQRAVVAQQSVGSRTCLAPGYAVLSGTVQVLDGAPCAVRIRIWQKGIEWRTKQGYGHRWSEFRRTVETWPFYLVQRDGQRIRIEPRDKVFLVDALDRADPEDEDRRVLTAELSNGESVVADGTLTTDVDPHGAPASYRSAVGTGWVLRPPVNDKMLLSAEPLQDRYLRRAAIHRRWAWGFAAALIALNVLLFGNFHLISFFGDLVQARVERTETYKTRTKNGGIVLHYRVHASHAAGGAERWELTDDISDTAYIRLTQQRAEGGTIPFRVVPFWPSRHQVGTRATLHGARVVIGSLAALLLGLGYVLHARRSLPWYDKRRVTHSGSGRLMGAALEA